MELRNIIIFLRLVLSLCLLSALSGCLLTDSFKQELIDKNTKTEIQKKIDELEETYTLQELSKRIKDIERITPDLSRIIEMENNLAYLTNILETDNKGDFQSDIVQGGNNASVLPSLQDLAKNQVLTNPDAGTNTSVELSAARPISVVVPDNMSSQSTREIDNKFSGVTTILPVTKEVKESSLTNTASIDDKFSTTSKQDNIKFNEQIRPSENKVSEIVGTIPPKNEKGCFIKSSSGGQHSIHLASYTSMENAKTGWSKLMNRHNSLLCDLQPKLAEVSVKGKEYLSLRVGPLSNKNEALDLCAAIRAAGDYCASAEYFGNKL